jgi:hypothetical protein
MHSAVRVQDSFTTSMLEDRAERLRRLRFNLEHKVEQEPASYCAFLLGEHTRSYCGMVTKMLVAEIRGGRLQAAGDVDRSRHPWSEKRRNPGMVPISRDALRAWLEAYGTDEMRRSAAAVWCGLFSLVQFERS